MTTPSTSVNAGNERESNLVGRGSGMTGKFSQGDCVVLIERELGRALPSRYLRIATCWDRLGTPVGAAHNGRREDRLPWSILSAVPEPRPTVRGPARCICPRNT